jgi:hypothetical protein
MNAPFCTNREFRKDKEPIITVESGRGYTGGDGGVISFSLRAITAEGNVNGRVEYSISFPYLRSADSFHIYKRSIEALIGFCNSAILSEYKQPSIKFRMPNDEILKECFEIVPTA